MSTNREKSLPEKPHSLASRPTLEKKRSHSFCSAELPSSTILFDDFFGVDRMVLERPSARVSLRRIFSEGPSLPMMPLPQSDGASDRRKLKRSKKQRKKNKNKTRDDNDDCKSERSESTANHEPPLADTENTSDVQARVLAAEVADLSGPFEQLAPVGSELAGAVVSGAPKADAGLTPALATSPSPGTPSVGTRSVAIEVLGPSGNNTRLSSIAAGGGPELPDCPSQELHEQTSPAGSSNARKQPQLTSSIDTPSGPAVITSGQTGERVECNADKDNNISTQPVMSMNHSGNLVCSLHQKPLCQFNPKCCVHQPKKPDCSCPLKSSCCCVHHLGDCCFCVFVPEGKGFSASEFEKASVGGRGGGRKDNDVMAGDDTSNNPASSKTADEHKSSNASDGNKAPDWDKNLKEHINIEPKTAMDSTLSPREANKSWDEIMVEEEEKGIVSSGHVVEPKKPIDLKESVAEKADLGFVEAVREIGLNKTTELGKVLTPGEGTDEDETIKPADSVAPEEALQDEKSTFSGKSNESGETIKSGQPMMAEDKAEAGELVRLNGRAGPKMTSENTANTQVMEDNGHNDIIGEREKSRPEEHVDSKGDAAPESVSSPFSEANEIGKNLTTTAQTNAVSGISTKLLNKPPKQDTMDVVASLDSTMEERNDELLKAMSSLANHLMETLENNNFSDLSIVLRSSSEQFLPVCMKAHKISIARSPFIATLLKTPVDQIVAVSGDRFSMLQAFELALRTMYGIPVLTGDQLKPVTLSALGYDDRIQPESFIISTSMMDFTLGYAASGAFFQQPRVVEAGIKLAIRLIDLNTIPLALWFGLDAAKFSVVFDDTAHPQLPSSDHQSTEVPSERQLGGHPTIKELQERWSPFLVTACLKYIADKVSPDFRLFEHAQFEELPDRVPEHLRSAPGTAVKNPHVKDVGFGSMPSIKEQKPSTEVELISAALICLPYKALQELFPLLDAKGVLSAGLAGRIVAAREDRRIHALRILGQQGPGMDEDDIPNDIRELGYRELFTTRLISVAGELDTVTEKVTLERTWKGLSMADQASSPTEKGSPPTHPPALLN